MTTGVFKQIGSLTPYGAPVLKRFIIANSQTTVVLDSVQLSSGFLQDSTTSGFIVGHIIAHTNKEGVGLLTTGAAGAAIDSYVNSFAASSTNQTVAMYKAQVDVSKNTIYSNSTDNTLGTTTGSNLAGYYFNLANATTLSESSSATTTTLQYVSFGVDPQVSTLIDVKINTAWY